MLRSLFALGAAAALVLVSTGAAACGAQVVRNADDASRYVDEVLRGAGPQEFTLAKDATPSARAAMEDAGPLSDFRLTVEQSASTACDVAGVVNAAANPLAESVEPVTLETAERDAVYSQVNERGIATYTTTRVVNAALDMAQSTWVEAADKSCNIAQQL